MHMYLNYFISQLIWIEEHKLFPEFNLMPEHTHYERVLYQWPVRVW